MLRNEIIKERKKLLRLKIEDIVEATGASRASVCRWISGETRKISPDKLQKLADVLETTPDHLLGKDVISPMKPILGIVKAGYNMYAEENILGYEGVTEQESKQGDFYLKVCGDSMVNARICDGDLLYVKACNDVESGQIAIVLIGNEEATVKKVIKKDHILILEAANPKVENRYFDEKDIEELPVRIIGKVLYNKVKF
ncbi:MAG: LexA family protein [Traorella sp.]